jgi:hypothetical protein
MFKRNLLMQMSESVTSDSEHVAVFHIFRYNFCASLFELASLLCAIKIADVALAEMIRIPRIAMESRGLSTKSTPTDRRVR